MPTEFAEKMIRDCGYRYALDQDEGRVFLVRKQTDSSTEIPEAEIEWLTGHGVPDPLNMAFWDGFNEADIEGSGDATNMALGDEDWNGAIRTQVLASVPGGPEIGLPIKSWWQDQVLRDPSLQNHGLLRGGQHWEDIYWKERE